MKANKEDRKGGMQYIAQMRALSMDRAQVGLNEDQNMLRWGPKYLGMQAYKLSHKLGNNALQSMALKEWMMWEHGNAKCSEIKY